MKLILNIVMLHIKLKGLFTPFFQMPLYLSLQYGRNNSSLNVCECPSISL